jgi:SNF2 family DNA or RNA helicase
VRLHSNDHAEQERLKLIIKDASQTEVVLTTYETVKSAKLSNALRRIVWRSVILDEGHKLKNEESAIYAAAKSLRSRFKLILTGTPVSILLDT